MHYLICWKFLASHRLSGVLSSKDILCIIKMRAISISISNALFKYVYFSLFVKMPLYSLYWSLINKLCTNFPFFFPDSWIGINLVDFLKSEQKVKISKWLIDNFANCGINSFYMHFAKCGDLWSFMNIFLMVKGKS